MEFEDILYEVRNGVAWITINRPDKMNAFRGQTCDELIKALQSRRLRPQRRRHRAGRRRRARLLHGRRPVRADGNYGGRGTIGLPMEELHTAIRDVPSR